MLLRRSYDSLAWSTSNDLHFQNDSFVWVLVYWWMLNACVGRESNRPRLRSSFTFKITLCIIIISIWSRSSRKLESSVEWKSCVETIIHLKPQVFVKDQSKCLTNAFELTGTALFSRSPNCHVSKKIRVHDWNWNHTLDGWHRLQP